MGKPVHVRRSGERRSGQSLVEFSLVLPIFILMLFGVVDVGRLIYANAALSQAAREGARLAAAEAAWIGLSGPGCVSSPSLITAGNPGAHVCPATLTAFKTHVADAVNRMAVGLGPITAVYVSCNAGPAGGDPPPSGAWTESSGGNGCATSGANGSSGDMVSVRVAYTFGPITPIITSLIGAVPLSGSTTMVIN